jgi:hypothetical protein
VGYTTLDEIKTSYQSRYGLLDSSELKSIEKQVKIVALNFEMFRRQQTELDGQVKEADKKSLRQELRTLTEELDEFLAGDYGIGVKEIKKYTNWKESHQPFHWFVEFYSIMTHGGFNAIVGNPPYIEYHKVRSYYAPKGFRVEKCGNLYGFVIERCYNISGEHTRMGMIVQLSAVCTLRMKPLQDLILKKSCSIWSASFDDRPGKLFDGLEHIRASILLTEVGTNRKKCIQATNLNRWYTECRNDLFPQLGYSDISKHVRPGSLPKLGDSELQDLIVTLQGSGKTLADHHKESSPHLVYYYRSPLYWIRGMDFLPHFKSDNASRSVHHFKDFGVINKDELSFIGCVINSSLFYLWFIAFGNGRNVTLEDITSFPSPNSKVLASDFDELFARLMKDYSDKSVIRKRGDGVEYQEFYPGKSKRLMDEIDLKLGDVYGLSPSQVSYVINYDIKYRMGSQDD